MHKNRRMAAKNKVICEDRGPTGDKPGAIFESLCETFGRFANRIVEITKTNARARFGICLGVDACSPRVELQTR